MQAHEAISHLNPYILSPSKKFVFPAILQHWETYRAGMIEQLKISKDVVWSGDGRFDSMGHSAKYGLYTMFCCTTLKIIHFELLQVKMHVNILVHTCDLLLCTMLCTLKFLSQANQAGSSQAMELQGAKQCFDFLLLAGLAISVFIPDRHLGIAKWVRENHPQTSHFYDIWHVARSVTKKLVKSSKKKAYKK